jgi:hypothetical protein
MMRAKHVDGCFTSLYNKSQCLDFAALIPCCECDQYAIFTAGNGRGGNLAWVRL